MKTFKKGARRQIQNKKILVHLNECKIMNMENILFLQKNHSQTKYSMKSSIILCYFICNLIYSRINAPHENIVAGSGLFIRINSFNVNGFEL